MNTIKIYLAESGRIADLHKDFPLYQGQFQDKLLNVYVPTSILAPSFDVQHYIGQMTDSETPTDEQLNAFVYTHTPDNREPEQGDVIEFYNNDTQTYWLYVYDNNAWTSSQVDSFGTFNNIAGTNVKIGVLATQRNGVIYKSKTYYMRYLKTLTYNNVEYALYERKLPKEFTKFAGEGTQAPTIIMNVVDVDTADNTISSIVTSQSCTLEVMPSTVLDRDDSIEASELETLEAEINSLNAEMELKQDKFDEQISLSGSVENQTVVGAINDLNSQTTTNTLNLADVTEQVNTNTGDISDIKSEQTTQNTNIQANADDIAVLQSKVAGLESVVATGENYIGQMTGTTLPTDTQLNNYVYTTTGRSSQAGDVIIYILQVAGGTDQNYKYTYSSASSSWHGYEIPSTEPADNDTKGIVQGSYSADDTTTKTQVDIVNGAIQDIYVIDSQNAHRRLAEYLNTDHSTLSSTATQVGTNTSDIGTAKNDISTLQGQMTGILGGTTAVGKATKADQDGNGNNIAGTYLTSNAGVTKTQLREYALPRAFNDVSYINADNELTDTIPSGSSALYTVTTTAVGDEDLFYVDKEISNIQFQLASKNSYTTTLYVTASVDCDVAFRMLTQAYINEDWVLMSAEITEPMSLTANEIKKISFASTFNQLDDVITIADGDTIRLSFEVQTTSSASTTFNVYSNSTYPSTFYLNTTAQTIYTEAGDLGEIAKYTIPSGTLTSNNLSFALPNDTVLNTNTLAMFNLTYTGAIANGDTMSLALGNQSIQIVTPYNYGTNNACAIRDLKQIYHTYDSQNGVYNWQFVGFIEELNGDYTVTILTDDFQEIEDDISGLQSTTNTLQGEIDSKVAYMTGDALVSALTDTTGAIYSGQTIVVTANSTGANAGTYKAGHIYLIGGSSGAWTATDITVVGVTYTAGNGINIDNNNVISSDITSTNVILQEVD